jgi:iron complex transport system substrate-binding protein
VWLLLVPGELRATVTVTDDAGNRIELARPARRVIGLYGAFGEILQGMGAGKLLVARTAADEHDPVLRDLPSVGTHMRPNLELVLGLQPDLVLQMGGRRKAGESVAALQGYGIATAMFHVRTLNDLFSVIHRIGVLTGMQQQAGDLVRSMRSDLARVAVRLHGVTDRPEVFFEVRYPNLLAAGQGSVVSDVIRLAGGRNCVADGRKLVRFSEESLIGFDPDVYVLQQGAMNPAPVPLTDRSHYRTLQAVRRGAVHLVDEHLFSRPGPNLVRAVELLARVLHPERFNDERSPAAGDTH